MKIKKLLTFFVLFVFGAVSTYAKNSFFLPESVENGILYIFNGLPEGIQSGDALALAYLKFFLWILVFAIMYSSLKKVMPDNQNRLAVIAALTMSAIGVLVIPNGIMGMVFSILGVFVGVVLGLIPLLIIWFLNKELFKGDKKAGWVKGLMWVGAFLILMFMAVWIEEAASGGGDYSEFLESLGNWMEIAGVVALFIGMIMFFEGAEGMVKGDYSSKKSSKGDSGNAKADANESAAKDKQTKQQKILNDIEGMDFGEINNYEKIRNALSQVKRWIDNNLKDREFMAAFGKGKAMERGRAAAAKLREILNYADNITRSHDDKVTELLGEFKKVEAQKWKIRDEGIATKRRTWLRNIDSYAEKQKATTDAAEQEKRENLFKKREKEILDALKKLHNAIKNEDNNGKKKIIEAIESLELRPGAGKFKIARGSFDASPGKIYSWASQDIGKAMQNYTEAEKLVRYMYEYEQALSRMLAKQ